jgi:twitching motility protein PilT
MMVVSHHPEDFVGMARTNRTPTAAGPQLDPRVSRRQIRLRAPKRLRTTERGERLPQLDAMLRALVEKGASELVLSEGARPAFLLGGNNRPVSQVVLNRTQIVRLMSELAARNDVARLHEGENVRFVYQSAEGPTFDCSVGADNGSFAARVVPFRGESGAATAPAPAPEPEKAPEPIPVPKEMPAADRAATTRTPEIEHHLREMVQLGASDLHLSSDETPMLRLHGDMMKMEGKGPCSPEEAARLLFAIMPAKNKQEFEETSDTDFAYEIPGVARFRANVFSDRKGIGGVFRVIPTEIMTAEDLNLSRAILDLCMLPKGLVLVTGPTGSGKSTTLAAMLDYLNRNRTDHVITIEDPIEFVHPNKKCLINQREVGTHTQGFKKALRAALREDPDIVLVGEMRDLETIHIAIETAETGHLVFGTLHTTTAASTVDRIIDQFPADRQDQIRTMLAESLRGVIAQNLLKKIGGGRVAAMEVLVGIPAISNLIREGKTFQVPSIMQTGKKHGMVLLNDSLLDLVKKKIVAPEEAYAKAADKSGVASALRAAGFRLNVGTE